MFCFNFNDEMCNNFLISFFRKKIDLKKFVSAELRKAVNEWTVVFVANLRVITCPFIFNRIYGAAHCFLINCAWTHSN